MGPTRTGNILILYGHGLLMSGDTFTFKRAQIHRTNIYVWTRDGIPIWDTQIELIANLAIQNNIIEARTATSVFQSRIGGASVTDHLIEHPHRLRLPDLTTLTHQTPIAALGATVHHNQPTLGGSSLMVLMVDQNSPPIYLSQILSNINFSGRSLDVLWCACRSS